MPDKTKPVQIVAPLYDTPRWETTDEMTCRFWCGDVRQKLDRIPCGVVQTIVTSPPYWNLRDYGTGQWEEGSKECDHSNGFSRNDTSDNSKGIRLSGVGSPAKSYFRGTCGKCGAKRIDNQIGSEATPEEYVETMVGVFRKLHRILRHDGTVWLNLGDTYNTGGENRQGKDSRTLDKGVPAVREALHGNGRDTLKSVRKGSLLGIPWRVALALQEDGWLWRSAMPWVKRNAMPESCTDRPASSLEYFFQFSKSDNYFYDAESVRQALAGNSPPPSHYRGKVYVNQGLLPSNSDRVGGASEKGYQATSRNFRNSDLWFQSIKEPHGLVGIGEELVGLDVVSQSSGVHHFATFPPKLITPLILAGTSEYGCCANCRAPIVRVVKPDEATAQAQAKARDGQDWYARNHDNSDKRKDGRMGGNENKTVTSRYNTVGWELQCNCDTDEVIPCTVFDPFMGSGTTAVTSLKLGRYCWGVELSESYLMGMAVNQVIGELEKIDDNKWLVP